LSLSLSSLIISLRGNPNIIKNRFSFFHSPKIFSSDAKDISPNTQTAAEMFMNPTEMFESTGTSAFHSDDDNELSGDDVQTSTHMPMPMTLHTTILAAATATAANTIETIMEEQSNRLFVATDGMGEQQRHFTVPNETSHHHTTTNVTLVSYNLSNFNNSNNSSSSMTLSHDNNRNSSNISFNNIKFTTMKPCKPLSSHIVH
jgi:hypothetical protein